MGIASTRFKVAFEDYYISKRLAGDEQLEENLRYYEELEKEKVKILLLGTTGCGKSTFLTQLRIIHGDVYTDEELVVFLSAIHLNLITAMKILLVQAKRLSISGKIISQKSLEMIDQYSGTTSFLAVAILKAIEDLWADPIIKSVWNLRKEFSISNDSNFLLDKCGKIATPGYMPDCDDILHCYVSTTGKR